MNVCDIGKLTDTQCHLDTYPNLKSLHDVQQFSDEDRLLLKFPIIFHKFVITIKIGI